MVVTDKVFHYFDEKAKEFKKLFGYPMYQINSNGSIDYNYEIFALEFFNYSVLYPNYNKESKDKIKGMFAKTLAKMALDRHISNTKMKTIVTNVENLSKEQIMKLTEENSKDLNEYDRLYLNRQNATNKEVILALLLDANCGNLQEYLAKFGIITDLIVKDNVRKFKSGDIIASCNASLYKEDKNGRVYKIITDMGSHYVYVVGVLHDGRVVVSSYGEKYSFDDSKTSWISKMDIKLTKAR